MFSLLRYGVILSFFFSVAALSVLILNTFSYGKKALYARPRGDQKKGIFYALGRGLMPWEKESTRKHLPTYAIGISYHLGIFSAFFYLFSLIVPFRLSVVVIFLLRIFIFLGLFCGFALFIKRILQTPLRKISCPDDFTSNLLVDIFLVLAFAHTIISSLQSFFYLTAILLFIYIPLGKIRHCLFFFYIRILFGLFFGRRGVFPRNNVKYET